MNTFRTEITNGLYLFLSLGFYFLIIDRTGLSGVVELRLLNAVIVLYFLNNVIKTNIAKGKISYLENLGSSLLTALLGITLSVMGLWVFLVFFRGVGHISELATSVLVSSFDVSFTTYCISLLIEGLSSSFILSFILMQRWKAVTKLDHVV